MKCFTVMTDYILTYVVSECETCGNETRSMSDVRPINDIEEIKEAGMKEIDQSSMPDVSWYDDEQGKEVCPQCFNN